MTRLHLVSTSRTAPLGSVAPVSLLASFLVLFLAFAPAASAQTSRVELTGSANFYFEGNFDDGFEYDDFFEDQVEVDEGDGYGLSLGFALNPSWMIEFSYTQQETQLQTDFFFEDEFVLTDIDVSYLHVNAVYQWPIGQVRPFVLLGAGATQLDPADGDFDDESRFSFGFGGGVKIFFGDNVGIRLQGRLLTTLIDDNDAVFCDRFDDFCYSYDDESYLYQPELSGGLILAF